MHHRRDVTARKIWEFYAVEHFLMRHGQKSMGQMRYRDTKKSIHPHLPFAQPIPRVSLT